MPEEIEKCRECSGVGYVLRRNKHGEEGMVRCECYKVLVQRVRERESNIPARFAGTTFEKWQTESPTQAAGSVRSRAYRTVREFTRSYLPLVSGQKGLLLVGPPGTGKTHLAIAALREIIRRGFDGVFFDYQSLLSMIQRSWDREAGEADRTAWDRAINTELLVLDDLGARRSLEWVEDVITEIITVRYNGNRPIIATTNLPDPALGSLVIPGDPSGGLPRMARSLAEMIGERSRSRLFEMCKVIDMSGTDDYRLRGYRQ